MELILYSLKQISEGTAIALLARILIHAMETSTVMEMWTHRMLSSSRQISEEMYTITPALIVWQETGVQVKISS